MWEAKRGSGCFQGNGNGNGDGKAAERQKIVGWIAAKVK